MLARRTRGNEALELIWLRRGLTCRRSWLTVLRQPDAFVTIAVMRESDTAAFADYVAATQRRWLSTAYRLCLNPVHAQDLTAQAWEKLYLKWPQVLARGDPNGYMAKVVHNLFIDFRRSNRYRLELPRDQIPETVVQESFVDALVDQDELREAWKVLTDEERVIVSLRVFDGYAMNEVSALLPWSHSTVKRRWESGCAKLRDFYRSEVDSA